MWLDIILFTAISCALEAIIYFAAKRFESATFIVNFYLTLSLLLIYRWNLFGWIGSLLLTLGFCLINGASWQSYIIYLGGTFALGLILVYFKKFGKHQIVKTVGGTLLYGIAGFSIVIITRSLIAFAFYQSILDNFLTQAAMEGLNLAIGIIILLICRKQNGLFEDMNDYLARIAEERKTPHA